VKLRGGNECSKRIKNFCFQNILSSLIHDTAEKRNALAWKNTVFLGFTSCSPAEAHRRFGGKKCPIFRINQ
jgi:hypothetical protein